MKTKAVISILLALLLSACHHIKDATNPDISLDVFEPLKVSITDGEIVVKDTKGEVISEKARFPIPLVDEKDDFQAKGIVGFDQITIMTIKGSCRGLLCNSRGCVTVRLPDDHPNCID